jgi:cyanophycinase
MRSCIGSRGRRLWAGLVVSSLLLAARPSLPAGKAPPVREPMGPVPGTLLVCGGGQLPDAIRSHFVRLAGGPRARLVVIATADPDADRLAAEIWLAPWRGQKVASLTLLHTRSRQKANDPAFLRPLDEATGVWISGGDQGLLTTAYLGTAVPERLRRVLNRGGVVGGTSAGAAVLSGVMITGGRQHAGVARGFGLLPGAIVDQHFYKRNRVNRLLAAVALNPGLFGLGVDEETAVLVRGRSLTVLGNSYAVTCLASSGARPVSIQVLRPGDRGDVVALSRAAVARARGVIWPPERPGAPGLERGTLVLGGGGDLPAEVWKRFVAAAGGPEAPVVLIPTAGDDPIPAEPDELKQLRRAGAKNVTVLHPRTPAEVAAPAFLAALGRARGVWFGGGREWRLIDTYQDTAAEKLVRDVLRRDGAVGGSAAGAAALGDYLVRGDSQDNARAPAEGYERGLGLLRGVAVDEHFFQGKHMDDLADLTDAYPQLLGLGLDEQTAVVVRGHALEVVGTGRVAIYDRRRATPSRNDHKELGPGERYDLRPQQEVATRGAGR